MSQPTVPTFVPGIVPAPFDARDADFAFKASTSTPPAAYDGRKNYPPLPDQGHWGSCAANAGCVEMQKAEMAKHRAGIGQEALSRADLYDLTRIAMGTFPQDSGSNMRTLCKVLQKQGVCLEREYPYTDHNLSTAPGPDVIALGSRRKLLSYHRLGQDQTSYMDCISRGLGNIIGIAVYSSMLTPEVARTGIVPMPGRNDVLRGYHCVGEAAYDGDGVWFPNWWNTQWGEDGFGKLKWEYLMDPKLNVDAYVFNVVQ